MHVPVNTVAAITPKGPQLAQQLHAQSDAQFRKWLHFFLALCMNTSDARCWRARLRVWSMRMDRCIWMKLINLIEIVFTPAIRRVRAEIDMPASEVGQQIATTRIREFQKNNHLSR